MRYFSSGICNDNIVFEEYDLALEKTIQDFEVIKHKLRDNVQSFIYNEVLQKRYQILHLSLHSEQVLLKFYYSWGTSTLSFNNIHGFKSEKGIFDNEAEVELTLMEFELIDETKIKYAMLFDDFEINFSSTDVSISFNYFDYATFLLLTGIDKRSYYNESHACMQNKIEIAGEDSLSSEPEKTLYS